MALNNNLEDLIAHLNWEEIRDERKELLSSLVDYIQLKVDEGLEIRLNFVCTHNSRRSHLSQIWARVAAYYFDIGFISRYSGGTEATALFPIVAETLSDQGFEILKLSETNNPIYGIKYDPNADPIIAFSKTYDHPFNPMAAYAAVMTCSHADENCPVLLGAEKRIPVTYDDPKAFDGTDIQKEKYAERSLEIATEMFYVFSQIQFDHESD